MSSVFFAGATSRKSKKCQWEGRVIRGVSVDLLFLTSLILPIITQSMTIFAGDGWWFAQKPFVLLRRCAGTTSRAWPQKKTLLKHPATCRIQIPSSGIYQPCLTVFIYKCAVDYVRCNDERITCVAGLKWSGRWCGRKQDKTFLTPVMIKAVHVITWQR